MDVGLFSNLLSTDAHCPIIILSVHNTVDFRKAASRGPSALADILVNFGGSTHKLDLSNLVHM